MKTEIIKLGPLDGSHVLVLRRHSPFSQDQIGRVLDLLIERSEELGLDGVPMIVTLTPGESLELLDEDAMREAGWVRAS